jgi:hypothetical protein
MATTSTFYIITNPDGDYWDSTIPDDEDSWTTDCSTVETFPSKQAAKDAYRAQHGKFPRNLNVRELDADEVAAIAEREAYHSGHIDEFLAELNKPGTEVEVYEDAELVEVEVEDDTVHEAELVDDDDLVQLAATANRHYADFESAGHNALVAAWNCGAALSRAKALVGHGEFKPWVEANFDGSYSLASSYMRIAANVQRSELSEHDSINGVLKAIAAGKDRPAKPERSVETRARNIRAAADKLAAVVAELAADIDVESGAAIEADLNWAADVVAQAFQRIDNAIYGRDR